MTNHQDSFVHLHGHSHYSLLDGGATVPGLCARAAELGMPALGLTDHGNLFGMVEFYQEAQKAGIKPLLGCEFYVAPGSRFDKDAHGISDAAYHLVVLAKNQAGYKNMLKLASLAYTEGFYYRPRVDKETLARYSEGLVVINGHFGTEIATCLQRGDLAAAVDVAGQYKTIFGENFFVELQNHDDPAQISAIPQLLDVAKKSGCPVVATNDHHYLLKDDYEAHDVLCCISMGKTLADQNRLHYSRQLYLKSPAEMRAIFRDLPEACDNTLKIAEMCEVQLDFSKRHAPVYTPPQDPVTGKAISADDYLRRLCEQGVVERYGEFNDTLRQRLEQELKVIQNKGFSSYFLIVWDFCNYARQHDIPVGARGSGVGTLVGYALGLCNVDPIRYDLLFERFMDPSRSEMPDIDIDICQEGRGKVIEYVRKKYGNVSQIITFSTLGAKAAIKDVGRVLAMPLAEVDKITKLIPGGVGVTLDSALQVADLKKLYKEDPNVMRLFDIARRLEGLCRNAGMHAAGVIVCDKPLDEVVPLYKSGEDIMTQWDGPTCEKAGLLKMDFLGLRTLTIVERALALIEADYPQGLPARKSIAADGAELISAHPAGPRPGRLDIEKIDLTDQCVYKQIFQRGQTKGVFQFESPGMRELLIKMKPDRIEDLIAANALFRPGPMDLIPDYCARKHRLKPVPSVHPIMDKILAETYGIMVYQEQVMRIFNQLGGIPLAKAYKIIKAISKKQIAVIAAEKQHFLEGAEKNGIKQEQAAEIFALIEEFGKYGFNKSHSTRYAIVAYQTAYLKKYFPLEYMAALLTYEMIDQAKTTEYIEDCRFLVRPDGRVGIPILPPDINQSVADFGVVDGTIRFGLAGVKGVGQKAVESIMAARENGADGASRPFTSLFDFCERVDLRTVNKSVIESLIKCGAFDALHHNRAAATAAIEAAMQSGNSAQNARRAGQESLFGGGGAIAMAAGEYKLPAVPEWPQGQKMANEKAVLGFYVTSHPLRDYEALLHDFTTINTQSLKTAHDGKEGILGGLISKVESRLVRSGPNAGQKWATIILEDLSSNVKVTMFAAEFQKYGELIKADAVLLFRGKVDRSREEPGFRVYEVLTPEQAVQKLAREVLICVDAQAVEAESIARLREALQQYPGRLPAKIQLTAPDSDRPFKATLTLGKTVSSSAEALRHFASAMQDAKVRLLGPGTYVNAVRTTSAADTAHLQPS
ncbi:MAG: DNA polymerase III subunit alpha [Planctomycetia bacterium]|nr:DNA polymerase III subunit alpha [Planctomycetia bacterium]